MVEANTAGDANLSFYLADLDSKEGTGVTEETGFEGQDLAEGPRPQVLMSATRNLKAVPGSNYWFFKNIHIPNVGHCQCPMPERNKCILNYILSLINIFNIYHMGVRK